jgi:Ca-activated chloride channel family protein
MNFAHPAWLLLGLAALLAMLWVWRRHDLRQRGALEQFIAPHLRAGLTQTLSTRRRAVKRALLATAVVLAFAALAQPQAGSSWETFTQRGNDILFAVDTSRSMSTPDVKPTRLERAKLAINDFVDRLNGDAVGLVAFAGNAFIQTPLTVDYGAFRESLAALDVGIVPRGGTNITSAIQAAQRALHARPGGDKILILVTDGEDLEGNSLAAAKAAASQDGLKIYTVGVGSANGDLIPLSQDQGGGFLKDSAGRLVKSHLDEAALKALARATGGIYAPLGADNRGLDTIYQSAIAPLAKHALESRAQKIYTERFQWPLGAAILALLASLAVGTRRTVRRRVHAAETPSTAPDPSAVGAVAMRRVGARRIAVPTLVALIALGGLLRAPFAHASSPSAAAAAAYGQGNYAAAAKDYAAAAAHTPQQPLLQFNAGAAAYKAGSYEQAAHAFQASVDAAQSGSAKRLGDQEDAYYNLGDSLYRQGEQTEQTDAQQTLTAWTNSLKAYDSALELRPEDADGKFNRDLVKRKLDALKQQQQQQQQQSKQDQAKPTQSAQNQSKQDQSKQDQFKQGQSRQSPAQANSSVQNQSQQGQRQASATTPQEKGSQAAQSQPSPQQGSPPQAANNPPSPGNSPQPANQQPTASGAHSTPGAAGNPGGEAPRGGGATSPGAQLAQNNDDQRTPGGMSREEARELLDSVKDAKQLPPTAADANAPNAESPDEPLKDW